MKSINGRMAFGFWEGMPYGAVTDAFDDFKAYKNEISKEVVISHIESLSRFLSSETSVDLFDGGEHHSGIYNDGKFTFPVDFLRYYKRYDIGIPLEYEEYLKAL